jgi:hypothetical protein
MKTMEDDSAKAGLYRESLLHFGTQMLQGTGKVVFVMRVTGQKRHLDIATERLSYITLGAPIPIKSRL